MDLSFDASDPGLVLLGILALLTLAWVRAQGQTQRCPSCRERVRFKRSACPSCGGPLS